jgi:hypothetical protein
VGNLAGVVDSFGAGTLFVRWWRNNLSNLSVQWVFELQTLSKTQGFIF